MDNIEKEYLEYSRRIDARLGYSVWLHFAIGIALAPVHDSWSLALIANGALVALYYSATLFFASSSFSRTAIALIHGGFSSVFLLQMEGMYEMHFFYFIAAALLVLYQDWKVQVPLVVFTVVHHVVLYILHVQGVLDGHRYLFKGDITIGILFLQIVLVVSQGAICGWLSSYIRRVNNGLLTKSAEMEVQIVSLGQDIPASLRPSPVEVLMNHLTLRKMIPWA